MSVQIAAARIVAKVVGPTVAPILVAALVFIVLAGISIGIGTKEKIPGWAIFLLVAASAGLSGASYRGMKHKMAKPGDSSGQSLEQSHTEEFTQNLPQTGGESGRVMSKPVMPSSIIP